MSYTAEIADAMNNHGQDEHPLERSEREILTRQRLGLHHGALREFGWKNVHWGLVQGDRVFWFGYGDLHVDDLPRIQGALDEDEVFVAGWKDTDAPRSYADALGLGEYESSNRRIYITVTRQGARRDRPANTIF
jgi:hypothetical protein